MTSIKPTSGKWAAIISTALAVCIGLGLIVALTTSRHSSEAPKVTIGTKDTVFYYRGATKEDALGLGQALRDAGYLKDQGTGVILAKGKGRGGTVVTFTVKEGGQHLEDATFRFAEIGRRIAPSIGGFPFKVRLADEQLVVRKEITVGKATIGTRDTIFYYGTATEQDAVALGQALKNAGAMKDAGVTLLLEKGDVTSISFVLKQAPWERPEAVAVFESLMRQVAPSVGGLPLKLRFLDSGGVIHKELSIL